MANYDKIARYYDFLSRLMFFKSQVNAQINQLKYIRPNASILIVGGGTGWILEELAKVYPQGLKITYLEISEKMILISKKRDIKNNEVEFICSAVEAFNFNKQYDVVLTPFLFDNFADLQVGRIFNQLNNQLKLGGRWLMVDFSLDEKAGRWWRKLLLRTMYTFFKTIGIVETSTLIDVTPYFKANRFVQLEERHYYNKFIKAVVYQK